MIKIIFMGTSNFALSIFNKIIQSQHEILAVVSQTPKKTGRGMKLTHSPITQMAMQHKLDIILTEKFTNQQIETIQKLKPQVIIVVDFGLIIPKKILDVPIVDTINIHPSDLPKYRGAAPIERAIMNDEKNMKVCLVSMDQTLDTGDIILSENLTIAENSNRENLMQLSSNIGAELVLKYCDMIEKNPENITKIPQNSINLKPSYAKKIQKQEALIDWKQNVKVIYNLIRALYGRLKPYFIHNSQIIKIIEAQYLMFDEKNYHSNNSYNKNSDSNIINHLKNKIPGTIIVQENNIYITCQNGAIIPKLLQKEGKKIQNVKEFLQGYKF